MAQSPPTVSDVDVVGYTQQRSLVKDPCSLAAKEAITERTGKLCSGMDSLSVALKLRQEHLLSENDLEAVRDFQWVKEAKNSRILQSVKNAITVIGVKGFQDFLSILGEYPLLHSVVTDLQELYDKHLKSIQKMNDEFSEFWEQHNAPQCTTPVQSIRQPSSNRQPELSSLHGPHVMPVIGDVQGRCGTRPPCAGSSFDFSPFTQLSSLQPMSANYHYSEHRANEMLPHAQSKLLSLMPIYSSHTSPPSYTHTLYPSQSMPMPSHSDQQPCPSNSAPLCSTSPHLIPGRLLDRTSSSYWPVECPNLSVCNAEQTPSQSSPTLMQSDDVLQPSAFTDLTLEQPTSSPLLLSAFNQPQPASPRVASQQEIWLPSRSSRHSSFDSGVSSLRSNSVTARVNHFAEGPSLSPQLLTPTTQMTDAHSNSSSSGTSDSNLEEHGGTENLHRQGSFDEGNMLNQQSHTDSMDSGITGSQASLDNEDEAH